MSPACAASTTVLCCCVSELPLPGRERVQQAGGALNLIVVGTGRRLSAEAAITREESSRRLRLGERRKQIERRLGGMGASCSGQSAPISDSGASTESKDFRSITDDEWKKRLNKEQYRITRQKGTERAFTGQYWNTKTAGTYVCVCCDTPLFESSTKFDSRTGWPSFWDFIPNSVKEESDFSIPFMPRTEVLCAVCDAHLGHVFNDGPAPTRKRFCINSASLTLQPKGK